MKKGAEFIELNVAFRLGLRDKLTEQAGRLDTLLEIA